MASGQGAVGVSRVSGRAARSTLARFAPAAAILAVQVVLFPLPAGVAIRGLTVGLLGAMIALGMALVYRANRIVNFAQADLGAVPTALAANLVAYAGVGYWTGLGAGLVAAIVVGALVELVIVRRFFTAPRLILTVATLGLAQLLAAGALLLPRLWGERPESLPLDIPWDVEWRVDPIILNGDDLFALIVAPLVMVLVAVLLARTDVGIAIRASSERADRASLLGVPVKRLQTVVWVVAALLAFSGAFLRAGVVGLPIGGSVLSFGVLLRSLAALVLGRMTDLPAVVAAAVALGLLEQGVGWNASSPLLIDPIVGVVIVVAMVMQARGRTRAAVDETSSWRATAEVRPVPRELRRLPEVRAIRWGLGVALAGAALWLPHLLDARRSLLASAALIFAIIGLSLLVLTGWAGQVSLGQMGLVGIGAAFGAVATSQWNLGLLPALLLSGVLGAGAAVLVGLPALRLRGLLLAVTTFALGLTTSSYLLNRRFFDWVPTGRIERPPLLGRISYDSPTGIYYLVLAWLVLVGVALIGIRRSRTGRVLIALRDNEPAAQAYSVSVVRAKLVAFSISGFIAALAGALFVHHQQAFDLSTYNPFASIGVFTAVVIGGLGSMVGVLIGGFYLSVTAWFLPSEWRFLAGGFGVLLILMVLPEGIGGLLYRIRDNGLRAVARRRGLVVPSLLADRREPDLLVDRSADGEDSDDETPTDGSPTAEAARS